MAFLFGAEHMERRPRSGERFVAGLNTVIHCHHYNSRLQKTVEGIEAIDGMAIFRGAAEEVFSRQILEAGKLFPGRDLADVAADLFRYLGFGRIDFSRSGEGLLSSGSSHFVEGWKCGHGSAGRNTCTFTEGFLQAALLARDGRCYEVREIRCMSKGASRCEFRFQEGSRKPAPNRLAPAKPPLASPEKMEPELLPAHIDARAIIEAVFSLPAFGNESGLIPAFNVYLAHMPADFYNLVSFSFLEKMQELGMEETAMALLYEDAETCGLNTFAGILHSDEWAALIQPMIREESDKLFALIAVANALGWGRIRVVEHEAGKKVRIHSANGYEAQAAGAFPSLGRHRKCAMLTGVLAGLMELVYVRGDFEERKGRFVSEETGCLGTGEPLCAFEARRAGG